MVFFAVSHYTSSSLSNPCPSGSGIGYGEFNGTIFVICDAAFNNNNNNPPSALALGLGLGLGLGIPIIAVAIWGVVYINSWCCYRDKYEVKKPVTAEEIREFYMREHGGASTPKEYVKNKLGPELFQNFIRGNLTNELKKKLFALREECGHRLLEFEEVANELNQNIVLAWLENLSYTTLQDEGIV